jgi:uncharacterized protein YndB with AHSA1/START domain
MTTDTGHLDMTLTRELDAPVDRVWKAWTEAEQVKRWWGPAGFTAPVAEMDVREGGQSLVCMRSPAEWGGQDIYNTWTYSVVVPQERLEYDAAFTDADRRPVKPADLRLPAGVPDSVPHRVTLEGLPDGRTKVTVVESGYTQADVVEISRAGMSQCLDKMAEALATS